MGAHFWPTPNLKFAESGMMNGVLQPTVSGELSSALFGCVRNNGSRFHEGIDLRPIARDARGESLDPVFAFDDGVVRYVNRDASSSSYGRYVVVEHPSIAPGVVSLYAHLRSVPSSIQEGVSVLGGQEIAIMGRSASGYTIPKQRAHLHFEIGFWLGSDFQRWYDRQPFNSKNEHGAYNGMNIIGLDAWEMYEALRQREARDAWEFIASEPVAVEVFVREDGIPELLRVNPHLMSNLSLPPDHAGWRIELTWYGLPVRFTALTAAELPNDRQASVRVRRPELLKGQECVDLAKGSSGFVAPGGKVSSLLGRLFLE